MVINMIDKIKPWIMNEANKIFKMIMYHEILYCSYNTKYCINYNLSNDRSKIINYKKIIYNLL